MTFADYIKTLTRHWRAVIVFAVVGAAVGYTMAATSPNMYRSTSSVLVTSEGGGSAADVVQGSTYVENLVASYTVMATSDKVLQPVVDELGLPTSSRALAASVSASSPLNTAIIDISVVDGDPVRAQQIGAAVTRSLNTVVAEVSPQIDKKPVVRLTVTQGASLPLYAYEPRVKRSTALWLLIGLVLGVGYALVRRFLGSPIGDADDVASVSDAPVVGEVVEAKRGTTLPAAVLRDQLSMESESLRRLTANLNFLAVDGGLRSVALTSASSGEAKSSVATATAIILAESAGRVLLIDADLRSPSLHTFTQLDNTIGLSTVLIGENGLEVAVQPWGREGLDVLTSGPKPPNPSQLLNSDAMRGMLEKAVQEYDMVIVDTAPLLSVSDAVWIGHMVDGVLVVARRGRTTTRSLAKALDVLTAAKTSVSGIVISRIARGPSARYGYGDRATTGRFSRLFAGLRS